MKSTFFFLLIFIATASVSAQTNVVKGDPNGKWKFDAPYAPEGYNSGTIEIKTVEQKLTATLMFTGNDYKIPLEKVKFENDTLKCSLYLESEDIQITVKFEEADKMAGNALSSGGEMPLTLVREKENEK